MPARRGHDVSLIIAVHKVPRVLALANWSTIDGVNYARTDAPSLIRAFDCIVLPCAFLAMGVEFGNIGMVVFVPAAVTYLVAMVAGRAAHRANLACQVDRAIDLEAWRTNSMRSTRH
jgi:hypothetical protein